MKLANIIEEIQIPCHYVLNNEIFQKFIMIEKKKLKKKLVDRIKEKKLMEKKQKFEFYLNLRYQGTDSHFMILQSDEECNSYSFEKTFKNRYQQEYGFNLENRLIIIDDIRLCCIISDDNITDKIIELFS